MLKTPIYLVENALHALINSWLIENSNKKKTIFENHLPTFINLILSLYCLFKTKLRQFRQFLMHCKRQTVLSLVALLLSRP